MSLNGLNDAKIKEAHDAAAAEPGGWFLLKYASRDEIELLGRGNGGVVEIRNAISEYEETSPLYGFLRYRRRNVLIKYLPEGCSRLIQARVTVHFNAICERFSPHDTTFSITTAAELKDTKLSSACSLHAASGSTSSSTSSQKRRKLGEIVEEDEEEQQRASKRYSSAEPDPSSKAAAPTPDQPTTESKPVAPPNPEPPVTLNAELATSPEKGNFTTATDPPDFIGVPRPPSPAKSFDASARRMSSQSTRTEFYSYAYGRQKVKLGPRPSVDVSGRPRTATGGNNYRPISTIPAGFKLFSKGSKKGKSNKDSASDHSSSSPEAQKAVPEITFANIPIPEPPQSPVMEELRRPHTSSGRPSTSSGASFALSPLKAAPVKEKMTPEKARLMKAMQLREKKKRSMMEQESSQAPSSTSPAPAAGQAKEGESDDAKPAEAVREASVEQQEPAHPDADKDDALSLSKADSGIVLDTGASTITDQASEVTQTDVSHPASPFIASSEADHSTKASSLSESTDETIEPAKEENTGDEVPVSLQPDEVEESIPAATLENPTETPEPAEIETSATQTFPEEPTEAAEPVEIKVETIEDTASTLPEPAEVAHPVEVEVETVEDVEAQEPADTVSSEAAPFEANEEVDEEPKAAEDEVPAQRRIATLPVSKFSTANNAPASHDDGVDEPSSPVAEVDEPRRDERRMSLRIPKSKFSTHDLRAAAQPDDIPEVPQQTDATEARLEATVGDEPHTADDGPDPEHKPDNRASVLSKSSKRSVNLEIRTDIATRGRSPRNSCHLSDDEELLDELQSATVQEALPITVSKSPVTPVFPPIFAGKEGAPMGSSLRTASQPGAARASMLLSPMDIPPTTGTRSISSGAAFLHKITTQQQPAGAAALAPKKTNIGIGSSISQRIKALEKLSSNSTAAAGEVEARPNAPSANFFSVRKKPTVREPSRSPSVAERASSFSKSSPPPALSQDSSPDTLRQRSRERSGSLAKRLTMFESSSPSRGRASESVSVRARIVRDPSQPVGSSPPYKDPSEYAPLELKQSPLIVDHRRAAEEEPMPESNPAPAPPPKETIQERRMSREKRRSESRDRDAEAESKVRRSSLSIVKDFIKDRRKSLTSPSVDNLLGAPTPSTPSRSPSRPPSTHQNSNNTSFTRRLSISSRRSSVTKDASAPPTAVPMSPSSYTETSCSGDEKSSVNGEKRSKGRAGRFMRRLSSSLGSSRKNTPTGISPTLHEEVSAEAVDVSKGSTSGGPPSIAAYMGDVNVQFPDNLLWKRRWMCLDSQGFLILSTVAGAAPSAAAAPAAGVKRYHMAEFRAPYTPEMEVQELPNSVVLDFVEGSGLQIACEDRAGQLQVLHTLQEAHRKHSSFGQ